MLDLILSICFIVIHMLNENSRNPMAHGHQLVQVLSLYMNVRIMYALKQMMKEISFTLKNYKLTEEPGNAKNTPAVQKDCGGIQFN